MPMISIGMSTSCVFPLGTEDAFRLAGEAGYDGVEIMITEDPVTRDAEALASLSSRYRMPVLSVHAPVLPFTQFVWSTDPAQKLERSAQLAVALGASTVVVHPPYVWQPRYARRFAAHVDEVADSYGVEVAVENMFALPLAGLRLNPFASEGRPRSTTLDFSHAALAGRDSLELAMAAGDRLRHVHLCDSKGGGHADEHLVPGRGTQPVAEVLRYLASRHWRGSLIAEVATRGARDDAARLAMLTETVRFARGNILAPCPSSTPRSTATESDLPSRSRSS